MGLERAKKDAPQGCPNDNVCPVSSGLEPHVSVLITGIGCVGKSSLRRRVAKALGPKVVCVDRDDASPDPVVAPGQILVVESVHGLDEPPERWGLVVYLLPPPRHTLRWLRRGLAWLRTGQVDRPPRALRPPWSLLNLPLIGCLVTRNILLAPQWVREDLRRIEALFQGRVVITDDLDEALKMVVGFVLETKDRSLDD